MIPPFRGAPLVEVVLYRWVVEKGLFIDVPAASYWIGTRTEGKRKYIVTPPEFDQVACPDLEVLACGHERELKERYGHKWFNRRRRCMLCAVESSAVR